MFVIHKTLIILVLTSLVFCQYIDPDIELCNDLTIDAASLGDDNHNYAFKGQYFWTFDLKEGFTKGFAQTINDRWKGLPTPIDASFVIDDENWELSMIFIVNQRFYHYRETNRITDAGIISWDLPEGLIDAAFNIISEVRKSENQIIFFHNNNTKYSKYVFKTVYQPKHNITDKSDVLVSGDQAYFPYVSILGEDRRHSQLTSINDWMPLTAGTMTNASKPETIFFGKGKYCIHGYRGYCKPKNASKFFNCPRQARPIIKPIKPASSTDNTVNAEPGDGSGNQNSKSTDTHKNNKPTVVVWMLLIAFVFAMKII